MGGCRIGCNHLNNKMGGCRIGYNHLNNKLLVYYSDGVDHLNYAQPKLSCSNVSTIQTFVIQIPTVPDF